MKCTTHLYRHLRHKYFYNEISITVSNKSKRTTSNEMSFLTASTKLAVLKVCYVSLYFTTLLGHFSDIGHFSMSRLGMYIVHHGLSSVSTNEMIERVCDVEVCHVNACTCTMYMSVMVERVIEMLSVSM